jgi:hypothetical protein
LRLSVVLRVTTHLPISSSTTNNAPSEKELKRVQLAAHGVWKEIQELERKNQEAEKEEHRNICATNELIQAVETANKFKEARDLYLATLASLSSELGPTLNFRNYLIEDLTIKQNLTALHQLSTEEVERPHKLSDPVTALQMELEAHQLTLQVTQDAMNGRKGLIKTLQGNLSRLMKGCYPLRRLPREILGQMFQQRVFNDLDDYLRGLGTYFPDTAIKLSHVCQSWRSQATSQPELWCNIGAYMDGKWNYKKIQLFNHYLHHSKESPLEIYVEMVERTYNLSFFTINTIQNDYNLHFVKRLEFFPTTMLECLPRLKTPRSIGIHNFASNRLYTWNVKSLVNQYSVSQVSIHGEFNTIRDESDLRGLTSLTLDTADRISSAGLVPFFESIVELRLMNDEFTLYSLTTPEIIILPHLRVLGIMPTHQQITNFVQLPSLQTVIFYQSTRADHFSSEVLNTFASFINSANNLQFGDWSKPLNKGDPTKSASAFAIEILQRPTKFTQVVFSQGYADGSFLCEHLPSLVEQRRGSGVTLENIHFSQCSGLTRNESETLSRIVSVKVSI